MAIRDDRIVGHICAPEVEVDSSLNVAAIKVLDGKQKEKKKTTLLKNWMVVPSISSELKCGLDIEEDDGELAQERCR